MASDRLVTRRHALVSFGECRLCNNPIACDYLSRLGLTDILSNTECWPSSALAAWHSRGSRSSEGLGLRRFGRSHRSEGEVLRRNVGDTYSRVAGRQGRRKRKPKICYTVPKKGKATRQKISTKTGKVKNLDFKSK